MNDIGAMLGLLCRAGVDFIVVGGVAATIHGSTRVTRDLDVVYARDSGNIDRLVEALRDHRPYLRGAPPGLPFEWEADTIRSGLNFTLETDLGNLDLLGEIAGGGGYLDLRGHTIEIRSFGYEFRCLDLRTLIRVKLAAGRLRDLETAAELQVILEQLERPPER